MKLFKKTSMIPNQKKIEELELELGFTPIVTEENFEREFDRAVINDYREKYGTTWIEAERYEGHYYAHHKYYRDEPEEQKLKREWEERREAAESAFEETLSLLTQESSREAFREEFDPNHGDNYRPRRSHY